MRAPPRASRAAFLLVLPLTWVVVACATRAYNSGANAAKPAASAKDGDCAAERDPRLEINALEPGKPLRVVGNVPEAGGVARLDAAVKVFFNHKMPEESGAALTVRKRATGSTAADVTSLGTVGVEGPYLAWIPTGTLDPGATYEVTVRESVASKEGDSLDDIAMKSEDFSFSFTTVASFETRLGANVGTGGAAGADGTASDVVYRVQGGPECDRSRRRFVVDGGRVRIDPDGGHVYLNLADERRALQFLLNRAENATTRADLPTVVNFRLRTACAQELRQIAIPQELGGRFRSRPQIVDFNHGRDQFGIPKTLWADFEACVVEGSAAETEVFDARWDKPDYAFLADLLARVRDRVK